MKKMNQAQVDKFVEVYSNLLHDFEGGYQIQQFDYKTNKLLHDLVYLMERGINSGDEINLFMMEDSINEMRAEYMSRLYNLFTRIVANNKQDEALTACIIFCSLRKTRSYIPDALESYFFPQDAFLNKDWEYYSIWREFCQEYIDENNALHRKNVFDNIDPYLKELLGLYKKHLDSKKIEYYEDYRHNELFKEYMEIIIAYCYKEKYDHSIFPKIIEYVDEHVEEFEAYYNFNVGKKKNILRKQAFAENYMTRINESINGNSPIIR